MTRHTEKEINDAIAVVQQALRDARIEYESPRAGWLSTTSVYIVGDFRAKPDPVEGWVHEVNIFRELPDWASNPERWTRMKQADPEVTDEG